MGITLALLLHRMLHKFHVGMSTTWKDDAKRRRVTSLLAQASLIVVKLARRSRHSRRIRWSYILVRY